MPWFVAPLAALLSLRRDGRAADGGQSMVDYAMLTAVVVAAVAVAYQFVSLDELIQTVFNSVTEALD